MSTASQNNPVPTLAALMDHANAQWRVFDMGRKIQPISKSDFAAMEDNKMPYPFPIQQKARLAFLFWDQKDAKQSGMKNPFIWFLQFDLDEVGLLKLQQRDHFISIVISELGSAFVEGDDANAEKLNNHPYSFTPDQNRRAAFNSRVKVALKQPASMYYEHAQLYFTGQIDLDKWPELTVQGVADFAARIDTEDNEKGLIKCVDKLSVQILTVLAATLEHSTVSLPLTKKLIEQQNVALASSDHEQTLHLLRCLTGSVAKPLVSEQLMVLLLSKDVDEESLFLIIAGRFWSYLTDKNVLNTFFDRVACHPNQQLFGGIFADLVAIPETRQTVLNLLRDPERSLAVSRSLGALFGK